MLPGKIEELVEPVVDGKPGSGIAIGVFDGQQRHFDGYGDASENTSAIPTENTLYEIGSVTKLFTATLLACLAAEGLVTLEDPVQKHIPALPHFPTNITLGRLASHTAGLPSLPKNIIRAMLKDRKNPYANYTVDDLLDYLQGYRPSAWPQTWDQIHYSNLGMGLLGLILGNCLNLSYGEAIERYIGRPLGLQDTTIKMSEAQQNRFAQPHTFRGKPTPRWDMPALAGAGALLSTTADLLTFIEAHLDGAEIHLETACRTTLQIRATSFARPSKYVRLIGAISGHFARRRGLRFQTEFSDFQGIGLGWFLLNLPAYPVKVWFHNGATLGSHAMIAIAPETQTGVVVLTNRGLDDLSILFPKASVEEIGLGILEYLHL